MLDYPDRDNEYIPRICLGAKWPFLILNIVEGITCFCVDARHNPFIMIRKMKRMGGEGGGRGGEEELKRESPSALYIISLVDSFIAYVFVSNFTGNLFSSRDN